MSALHIFWPLLVGSHLLGSCRRLGPECRARDRTATRGLVPPLSCDLTFPRLRLTTHGVGLDGRSGFPQLKNVLNVRIQRAMNEIYKGALKSINRPHD